MKNLTIALLLILGVAAHAQQDTAAKPKRIETRTTEGGSQIVAIGHCAMPMPGFGTISSNFAYTVCQEYITANYEVEGSGWGAKKTVIPGSEKPYYRMVQKEKGHSVFVSQEDTDIFDFLSVQTACMSIRSATAGAIVPVSSTPCAQGSH